MGGKIMKDVNDHPQGANFWFPLVVAVTGMLLLLGWIFQFPW